ncbi:MAG TPA: BREX-1 system phosphatase PglZ type B [Hyphomicrobiaceae bacterium]|nr:BREX-1 system phosphatase PglZ type B [Hyphomicrobiaceae bacterium]
MTLIDAMRDSMAASLRTPDGVAAPVTLLWTDADGQWKPLLPELMKALPQLYMLGDYAPAQRQGPVIWLKCIIERTLPDVSPAPGATPILYLPNVARQDLRAGGDFPREKRRLMPLVELQYRGTVWHQRNGRDWTVEAFLTSEDGLGLDVARDQRTREAMLRALPLLGSEPVAGLSGRRLEAEDFDRLAIGDPVRDVLSWMSDAQAFEKRCDPGRWATFRDVCKRDFGFDPDEGGIQAAADLLRQGTAKWNAVWQRFCDAPALYPGIAAVLRRAKPINLLGLLDDQERQPGFNENQEDALHTALAAAVDLPHAQACDKVIALDEEHKERRGWVWARMGESPFAVVLEPLGRLARAARRPVGGRSVEQLIADYVSEGWRCDRAAIEALSNLKPGRDSDLINRVVHALYEPWVDASARRLQELLSDGGIEPATLASGVSAARETCVLFADGLRFDLGMMLLEKLEARGLRTRMAHRIAPIPTVTPTAKPLASPAHASCRGGNDSEGFCPVLTEGSKPVNAQRLRDAMVRQRIEVLERDETRMAAGAEAGGWVEIGRIDSLGHDRPDLLVHQIEPELRMLSGAGARFVCILPGRARRNSTAWVQADRPSLRPSWWRRRDAGTCPVIENDLCEIRRTLLLPPSGRPSEDGWLRPAAPTATGSLKITM